MRWFREWRPFSCCSRQDPYPLHSCLEERRPGLWGETSAAATTNGLSDIRGEIPVVGVQLLEPKKSYENGPRTLQNHISATPCAAPSQIGTMTLTPTTWLALREKRHLLLT